MGNSPICFPSNSAKITFKGQLASSSPNDIFPLVQEDGNGELLSL